MLLETLVKVSDSVGATRSRSAKTETLAALLRALDAEETAVAVACMSGHLRQGRIGLGAATLRKVAQTPYAAVATLSLTDVDRCFEAIAGIDGAGANTRRAEALRALLARATAAEADFLCRLVLGELRQGALDGVLVEALANASGLPVQRLRHAHMLAGDLAAVARAALVDGDAGLARFALELFRPQQPMLASPVQDLQAALQRLGRAALEHKLDGARIQVHRDGDTVRVFSRRMNEVTAAVPEVVEAVAALPARRLLLDGEVIALRADGSPQPFQVTMSRFARRLDVAASRERIPLTPFFFDLLHVDGEDLFEHGAEGRHARLARIAGAHLVPRLVTGDAEEAAAFLADALERGHEGIMAKALDSQYEAGGRGFAWLKIKPVHTLDLVVLAAEWGSGRRRGWLSNLHLGAFDAARGEWVMLGKTFKGLTDQTLAWQTAALQAIERDRDRHTVYVRPELVVEVAFSDVQRSRQYPGGMALRFARVKGYRPDKPASAADSVETVRALLPATD